MELEEAIKIYNRLASDERIREFEEARSLILKEMNGRKPELEFYKASNKYDYYIEKPYEGLIFEKRQSYKNET